MASQEIETLAGALARLPGLGPRTARRAVLWLVKRRETALRQIVDALIAVQDRLVECATCGNVDTQNPCGICADPRRDRAQPVRGRGRRRPVGARPREAVHRALPRARRAAFRARRRAARGPDDRPLLERVRAREDGIGIDEVVLAMNATLEGQTTAHYIAERLEGLPVRITQLAHGLPVGGELDYLDEGTLAQALRARRPVS